MTRSRRRLMWAATRHMGHLRSVDRLIPMPRTEETVRRYYHQDLPRLDDDALWSERILCAHALATRLGMRRRPRPIIGADITEERWLRERLAAIDAESTSRHRSSLRARG